MSSIPTTFTNGLAGWTINGDVQSFTWQKTGGDPGGFAQWVDQASGQDAYYVAPKAYLGNKSAYFRGTISYDVQDTGNNYSGVPDIELTGDGITLVHVSGQPHADGSWTHYSASLMSGGWRVGSHDTSVSGDPVATPAQMQDVLAHLTSIEIRAEYQSGPETGGLDSVVLATPKTTSPSHADLAKTLFDAALGHAVDGSHAAPPHESMLGALAAAHGGHA